MFPPPPNLKGWIPLRGLSVLIIPTVWYPDGSRPHPTQRVESPWRVSQCWSFPLYGTLMVPPPPNLKGWIPLRGFSVLIIPPVWYPDVPPPPNLKGWIPLRGLSVLIIPPVWYPDGSPPNLKGWIPLKVFSVLIIPPVWYPDGSPPTQPKGLNPLEGFISVNHSACMVPWWFPPTQPKGLNPIEGFLSVDHSACMVPWWFPPPPNLKGWIALRGFSVLIIPPVWYPDAPPPTQPKGLNPLEGFISVDHFACMVPWWFPPPTQPKGLNPLEGFISVDHSPCMVPWCFPSRSNLKGWIPLGFLSVDHSACMVPWWFPPHPT